MKLQIRSLLALAILGTATAAFAQEPQVPQDWSPSRFNEAHMWLGQQSLNGRSDFWDDNFQNFAASRDKLNGFAFGFDLVKHLDLHNAVMFTGGFTSNTINEPARNVLDEDGNPLEHHLDLDSFALTAGYVFYPAGTLKPVIPYLGAGAGLYAGELRSYRTSFTTDDCDEDGNCTTELVDKQSAAFLTFGYFALAGLEVPVSPHLALEVEGRYTVAQANLGGDFSDAPHLDLSGRQVTLGMAFRF